MIELTVLINMLTVLSLCRKGIDATTRVIGDAVTRSVLKALVT